jgi:hypothetical protein
MFNELPWQDIITGLIVLAALLYLGKRWWPGTASRAARHGATAAAPATASKLVTGCGSGCCGGCPHATAHAQKTDQAPR